MPDDSPEVTELLLAWGAGDEAALRRLVPLVHEELHRIAQKCMSGERMGHSLQPTALLNEAYLRFADVQHVNWQNRTHFLAMAARLMRRILVDHARARQYQKRGGGVTPVPLEDDEVPARQAGRQLVALDDALNALARVDERRGQIVELRFFGGLTVEETAVVIGVSPDTVMREWKAAKQWLTAEMHEHF